MPTKVSTTENERCVEHFEKNVSITSDGKFVVKLPFKEDRSLVANNRNRVVSSLIKVENKLKELIKVAYTEFLKQYEDLGHMSLVHEPSEDTCYKFLIGRSFVLRALQPQFVSCLILHRRGRERNP